MNMDWKAYYRDEIESPEGREYLSVLSGEMEGDPELAELLRAGAVLLFPHTALRYAAPLILRVVASLYRLPGIERVVALGVLHMGALPKPYQAVYQLLTSEEAPTREREKAFRRLAGGVCFRARRGPPHLGSFPYSKWSSRRRYAEGPMSWPGSSPWTPSSPW